FYDHLLTCTACVVCVVYLLYCFAIYFFLFVFCSFFFFNDPATSEIYTLSLHDALPIYISSVRRRPRIQVSWRVSWMRSGRSRLRQEPGAILGRRIDVAKGAQLRIDGAQLVRRHIADLAGGQQHFEAALAGREEALDAGCQPAIV